MLSRLPAGGYSSLASPRLIRYLAWAPQYRYGIVLGWLANVRLSGVEGSFGAEVGGDVVSFAEAGISRHYRPAEPISRGWLAAGLQPRDVVRYSPVRGMLW